MVKVSGLTALLQIKNCYRASLFAYCAYQSSTLVMIHSIFASFISSFYWIAEGKGAFTSCQDSFASLFTWRLDLIWALLSSQSFNMKVLKSLKIKSIDYSNKGRIDLPLLLSFYSYSCSKLMSFGILVNSWDIFYDKLQLLKILIINFSQIRLIN